MTTLRITRGPSSRTSRALAAALWSVLATMGAAPAGAPAKPARITTVASTVPANGDINPYGVAVVPRSTGNLQQGHILVSNFNNSQNQQGTGSTIVDI